MRPGCQDSIEPVSPDPGSRFLLSAVILSPLSLGASKGHLPCPSSAPSFSAWPLGRPDNPECRLARSAVPCLHPMRPAISPQTCPGNAAESEVPGGVASPVPEPPCPAGPWGTRVPSGLLPPFPRLLFLLSEPFAPVLRLLVLFSDLELHPRALLPSLPPSLCLVSSPDTICPTWGISRGRESLLGRPPILAKCTPCAGPGGRGPTHRSTPPCWSHPVRMWGGSSPP